jgi:transcriptional regulator with XRE-family HTH domain
MAIPSITRPYRDWVRLANAIKDRRAELGVTQDQCVEASRGGISRPTWSGLEAPHRDKLSKSVRALNACARVLGWTYDSCERVLTNQDPVIRRSEEAELSFQVWSTERKQRGLLMGQEEAEPRLAALEAELAEIRAANRSILAQLDMLAALLEEAGPRESGSRPTGRRSAQPRRRGGPEKN